MSISKNKIDYAFIALLGLFIVIAVYQHVNYGYDLSINNYAAFVLWALAVILFFTAFKAKEYSVLIILVLGTFNIINFSAEVFIASVSYQSTGVSYESPSVNLIMLLITLAYCVLNKKFIKLIFESSEDDKKDLLEKGVQFYLDKFSAADKSEWEQILLYKKDYPIEAQIAIGKLRHRKKR